MDLNLLFKAEEALNTGGTDKKAWKVIISDDDYEVHAVTRLALGDFTFEGRPLEFLSAYNGHETLDLMRGQSGYCGSSAGCSHGGGGYRAQGGKGHS